MRRTASNTVQDSNQLLFLPGVFNETLGLLFDAHHYFQTRGQEEQLLIAADKRLAYAAETSRITLRLTSIMAWIMVRRAVHAGNIEAEKADNDYPLDGRNDYLAEDLKELDEMPPYLNYLSTRSLQLYERVMRLEEQNRQAS